MTKRVSVAFLALLAFLLFFGQANSVQAISYTFNDLNVAPLTSVFQTGDVPFDLTNNTGITWTDFHFIIDSGTGPPVIFSAVDPYTGPGSATVSGELGDQVMDVIGLNIPSGSIYSSTVTFASVEGFALIGGQPTASAPVPEPATILLLSLGLIGLAGISQKKFTIIK